MRNGVVPFYVVCDQSYSMADHVAQMNDVLRELRERILADPDLAESARLCVIGFSDSARVVVPLCTTEELTEPRILMASAATNFASVFALLRDTIERDIASLLVDSYQVRRPTVIFLSDGQATDPAVWSVSYQRLIDPSWAARPRIVALALGDADIATIRRISTVMPPVSRTRFTDDPQRDRLGSFLGRVAVENMMVNLSPQVGDHIGAVIDPA
jgi:uncharacterized protein YegL